MGCLPTGSYELASWPLAAAYRRRYFVPDLSPEQRPQLLDLSPKFVFVAESPHISEVEPTALMDRRPLCGRAGQVFWRMIGSLVGAPTTSQALPQNDTSLPRLLDLCRQGRFAVMNAVQFPIDAKIASRYADADPVRRLGFCKTAPSSFKKLKACSGVRHAIEFLRCRLLHPSVVHLPVVSLGNDAQWFVTQALTPDEQAARHVATVPHPSAWWRQGGKLREKARVQLTELLCPRR